MYPTVRPIRGDLFNGQFLLQEFAISRPYRLRTLEQAIDQWSPSLERGKGKDQSSMIVSGSAQQGIEYALRHFLIQVDCMSRPSLEDLRVCHVLPVVIKIYRASSFSACDCRGEDCLCRIESVLLIILQAMIRALLLGTFVPHGQVLPNRFLRILNTALLSYVHGSYLSFGDCLSQVYEQTGSHHSFG